jgi:aminopeptidase
MLLELDEGSSRLGEVALVPFDSPISNTGILFYNTLFDENASCHLALGRAYPMNIKGGTKMSKDELSAAGANSSFAHVDFMVGSADMCIVGTKKDGTKVQIFKDGNFAF